MTNDSGNRTVKLAVRVVDGVLRPFYGTSWPQLKDGAIGELTLPARAFVDSGQLTLLTAPLGIPFIRRDETLMVAVSNNRQDDRILREGDKFISATRDGAFVAITTKEELRLDLRGTKRASLASCRCRIPSLDREAESVNEAYRIVSEVFEPERRSHAGNVFLRVFYRAGEANGKDYWAPLDDLRMQKEAVLEHRFGQPSRPPKD